uniref:Uncharacterized protein n=1 Tax=Vespula pensylvanica TaxID=30213 RepID=A0A834N8C8_VESPE|nr:hypothetical protein H0235_016096 [Vespula pensylvanica]
MRRRRSPDNLFKSIEDETPLGNLAESRWSRKRCSEEAARAQFLRGSTFETEYTSCASPCRSYLLMFV